MRTTAIRLMMLSAIVIVGSAISTAPAVSGEPCVPPQTEAVRGWTEVPAPEFPASDDRDTPMLGDTFDDHELIQAYAVDPLDPRNVYVTNHTTLFASSDGGCTWENVFDTRLVPGQPCRVSTCSDSIKRILIPRLDGKTRVFLVVQSNLGNGAASLLVSEDRFQTQTAADQGLPKAGAVWTGPWIAPSDPQTMYLTSKEGCARVLYRSKDGAASWERVTPQTGTAECEGSSDEGPFYNVIIDPLDAETLWSYRGSQELSSSRDGGKTWKAVETPILVTLAAVEHRGSGPETLWIFGPRPQTELLPQGPSAREIYTSRDGGVKWIQQPATPKPMDSFISATPGSAKGSMVLSYSVMHDYPSNDAIARFSKKQGGWIDITPVIDYYCQSWAPCRFGNLTTDSANPQTVYVSERTTFIGSALWRYTGPTK